MFLIQFDDEESEFVVGFSNYEKNFLKEDRFGGF